MRCSHKLLAVLAALLLALAACGGEEAEEDDERAEPTGTAETMRLQVEAQDFRFRPANIEVDPDRPVLLTVENVGEERHSFVFPESDVDVEIAPGMSTATEFTAPGEPGVYEYFCRFHAQEMRGQLFIGDAAARGGDDETASDEGY